jgi:hypothetical protein
MVSQPDSVIQIHTVYRQATGDSWYAVFVTPESRKRRVCARTTTRRWKSLAIVVAISIHWFIARLGDLTLMPSHRFRVSLDIVHCACHAVRPQTITPACAPFFFCSTFSSSARLICGRTPPKAIVARISVSSSSSPRMASCKWRGVIRLTLRSLAALPASSRTSAVKYSRTAVR